MNEDRRYLKIYGASFFFIFAAVAAVFPFYPLILQNKGFTPSQIGFIMGGYDLFSIGGLLILGYLYDKLSSPKLTITIIILISAILLLSLIYVRSSLAVIAVTFLIGFFVKSPPSLLDAHYGQTLPDLTESYGKTRLGGSLGFMLMALLIQVTGSVSGNRPVSVFLAYGASMIITIGILYLLPTVRPHEKIQNETSQTVVAARRFPPVFWVGLVIAFLNALALSGHYTFFSLLLSNKFSIENVSGFWAIGPFFEVPMFFFSTLLLKKFKLKTLWIFSMIAGFLRMQTYALASVLWPLYIIQATHSLSFGINHLCMINLINRKTAPESRGLAMSLYTAVGLGLSLFTGGILGGIILRYGDFPLLFQIFSLFPLAAIAVDLFFFKD